MEGCNNTRRRNGNRSRTYTCRNSAENEYFRIHGIFERTKFIDNISKIDKKDADSIAKLTDIEFIQTEDGIRKIFRAAKGTDTPAFHYGTTNWFLEKATS